MIQFHDLREHLRAGVARAGCGAHAARCRAPLAVVVTGAGAGAQAVPTPPIAATVVSTDQYPRRPASVPGGVTGRPDVTYTSWPGYRPLERDLYLYRSPDSMNARGRRPLVVYVHGTGWMDGTPQTTGAKTPEATRTASLRATERTVAFIDQTIGGKRH